jgi:hypothetical protein
MKRNIYAVLAALSAGLAILAFVGHFGYVSRGTFWVHWPATVMYSAATEMGLYVSPHGAFIRSAHGPPFLGPLGIAIVYAVPSFVFSYLAWRNRGVSS